MFPVMLFSKSDRIPLNQTDCCMHVSIAAPITPYLNPKFSFIHKGLGLWIYKTLKHFEIYYFYNIE